MLHGLLTCVRCDRVVSGGGGGEGGLWERIRVRQSTLVTFLPPSLPRVLPRILPRIEDTWESLMNRFISHTFSLLVLLVIRMAYRMYSRRIWSFSEGPQRPPFCLAPPTNSLPLSMNIITDGDDSGNGRIFAVCANFCFVPSRYSFLLKVAS